MFGSRLRQARLAEGLTLERLAGMLDPPVTKQALSKYERGISQPSATRIQQLAEALGVQASTLLADFGVEIRWVAYRKLSRLSKTRQSQVTAIATSRVDHELQLRKLFRIAVMADFPQGIAVESLQDCDSAAASLRLRWGLGDRPLDNLTGLLEDHGAAVVAWREQREFDGLSGWAGHTPVLVLNDGFPADRIRFNAAHEIGHLVMASTDSPKKDETFAHRFAASFLVPAEAARSELGSTRHRLTIEELGLLKQRWGFSMQAWIRRARDLRIINESTYRFLNVNFRSQGWHRNEPYGLDATESPGLYRRLILRAYSERLITRGQANQYMPGVLSDGSVSDPTRHSIRNLARLPIQERHTKLREAQIASGYSDIDSWYSIAHDEE